LEENYHPGTVTGETNDKTLLVRQKGSHIRLQKHTENETLKIIDPAHKPIKRSTLSHILKQAKISVDEFMKKL